MHISDYRQFSDIHISQGNVATCLRYGGIFKHGFVANLPLSLLAKNVCKLVNIWGRYGQEFSVLFFDSRSVQHQCRLLRHSVTFIVIVWLENRSLRPTDVQNIIHRHKCCRDVNVSGWTKMKTHDTKPYTPCLEKDLPSYRQGFTGRPWQCIWPWLYCWTKAPAEHRYVTEEVIASRWRCRRCVWLFCVMCW